MTDWTKIYKAEPIPPAPIGWRKVWMWTCPVCGFAHVWEPRVLTAEPRCRGCGGPVPADPEGTGRDPRTVSRTDYTALLETLRTVEGERERLKAELITATGCPPEELESEPFQKGRPVCNLKMGAAIRERLKAEGERDRLSALLAAETGRKGLEGWTWVDDGDSARHWKYETPEIEAWAHQNSWYVCFKEARRVYSDWNKERRGPAPPEGEAGGYEYQYFLENMERATAAMESAEKAK